MEAESGPFVHTYAHACTHTHTHTKAKASPLKGIRVFLGRNGKERENYSLCIRVVWIGEGSYDRNRRGFCFFVLLSTEEKKPAGKPDRGSNGCECPYVPETNNEAAVRSTIKPDAVGTPLTYESFTLYPICERAGQHCRAYEPRCPGTRIVPAPPCCIVCLFVDRLRYELSQGVQGVSVYFFSSFPPFLFWFRSCYRYYTRENFEIKCAIKKCGVKEEKSIEIL